MVRPVLRTLSLVSMLVFASPAHALANAARDDSGPPLMTPPATLAAALRCHDTPSSASHEPVLLIHGIASTAAESWDWNYVPALTNAGFDVCTVDLPDRALTDIQISTEYVVYAVRQMRDHYHSKVSIVGHSQGALEGRWAIKFWPDIRNSADDMIGLGAPTTARPAPTSSALPVRVSRRCGSFPSDRTSSKPSTLTTRRPAISATPASTP